MVGRDIPVFLLPFCVSESGLVPECGEAGSLRLLETLSELYCLPGTWKSLMMSDDVRVETCPEFIDVLL